MEKGNQASTSDMKSLSGGERSFSTLAFILALGGEISAAFHCLDEFDVFLDVQNRLVSHAWKCAGDSRTRLASSQQLHAATDGSFGLVIDLLEKNYFSPDSKALS